MKLLDFFYQESDVSKKQVIFTALVSGFANAILLILINNATQSVSANQTIQEQHFLLFIVDLLLFLYTKRNSLKQATIAAEDAIARVRVRVANKLRHAELTFIENSSDADIFTRITQDTGIVSEAAVTLINAFQQLIVVVLCLVYIAWISLTDFAVIIGVMAIAISIYYSNAAMIRRKLHESTNKEAEFFNDIKHILSGFKEVKINQKKNNAIFEHINTISEETKAIKIDTGLDFMLELMLGQTAFYILCVIIIFILPTIAPIRADQIINITIAILFLSDPVNMVVTALPMFARAHVAIENIYKLEHEIDQATTFQKQEIIIPPVFESLEFEQVSFYYHNQAGKSSFGVGPLNFKIKQGEVLFIVGGNGSGKSTVLKLLTGLYYPLSGNIYLNNKPLDIEFYANIRELYSTIFSDFHLFERFYGIDNISTEQVQSLLKTMGLERKTTYKEGCFSNVNLSTGQRKRLAYITAMLEDKQIYIFDEWAADQDPEFRQYFYEVLLKDLQAKGKTIIAVSHDDRYFSAADKIITMEYGQIVNIAVKSLNPNS
jgi:putative ATP-binding cassette transporter